MLVPRIQTATRVQAPARGVPVEAYDKTFPLPVVAAVLMLAPRAPSVGVVVSCVILPEADPAAPEPPLGGVPYTQPVGWLAVSHASNVAKLLVSEDPRQLADDAEAKAMEDVFCTAVVMQVVYWFPSTSWPPVNVRENVFCPLLFVMPPVVARPAAEQSVPDTTLKDVPVIVPVDIA